ncbi:hypothetical protein E4U55_004334 [Claviceps digitariae]|nr:hypothetical protein E4U55_004334 [Claviceps digitariae]
MSTAAVTPQHRVSGWNIHLLCGPEGDRFAGVFHPPGSSSLTYRDVVDELRLCFDIPTNAGSRDEEIASPWHNIAFGYKVTTYSCLQSVEEDALSTSDTSLRMISGQYLDESISTPADDQFSDSERRTILCLHIIRHTECELDHTEPVFVHLQHGCAKHMSYPSLRRDERYLPPGKASTDPHVAQLPYRKTIRSARGSLIPSKRSDSSSESLTKDSETHSEVGADQDVSNMIAPPAAEIPLDEARATMARFRTSCFIGGTRCAVSGKGRAWTTYPGVGPGIQACHIVPQQHYNVYPVPSSFGRTLYNPHRLLEAWIRTWSAKNSLAMFSHFHDLFDKRLFSIHPVTLRIRVFVPYDVLLEHHGSTAQVSYLVDRKALQHHYEMYCIENMAAKMLTPDVHRSKITSVSGIPAAISPLMSGYRSRRIASLIITGGRSSNDIPGDIEQPARVGSGPDESATSTCPTPNETGLLTSDDSFTSGLYNSCLPVREDLA